MKQLRFRAKIILLALLALLAVLLLYAVYSVRTYGTRWFSNARNVRVVVDKERVTPGRIYDRNGKLLRYSNEQGERLSTGSLLEQSALVHVLGDIQNQVGNGVEKFQARYLYGFDSGFLERLQDWIQGKKQVGDNISLSIDRDLHTGIVQAFFSQSALRDKNGAVVVMNYKTGEVLALVSLPVFDPHNIPESAYTDARKPFYNRATQSLLPPGSTFKLITMAAALAGDSTALSKTYACEGKIPLGEYSIFDYKKVRHGELSLSRALELSCNNIFAQIALELGHKNLAAMAEDFGFNDNFLFKDLVVENSSFPESKTRFELASSGIGQGRVVASPMHLCMMASAIANEGIMMEPLLLQTVYGNNGALRFQMAPIVYRQALSAESAARIKEAMLGVVKRGTATEVQVEGMQIAGKTGSADSTLDGQIVTHSWFVGFSAEESKPYAISVLVEAGGTGSTAAVPLAKLIFDYINRSY